MITEKKAFGVVGHPIEHSLSPIMHNAAFRRLGLDYRYEAYDVKPEGLEEFLKLRHTPPFGGLNVTIPHKVAVIKYMSHLDKLAELVGAVNTIKFESRRMIGYNTDCFGFIRALEETGETIKKRRILVLGAGGAARAIVYGCLLNSAEVVLANRTLDKAIQLAKEIKEKIGKMVLVVKYSNESLKDAIKETDILINATPVGMYPRSYESPIEKNILRPNIVVMDAVYNPVETKLLREAKNAGCKTIDGVGMLVHQGAESLRIWLGIEAPTDVMRKAVIDKLAAD